MGRKQGPRKGSMQIWPRKRCYDLLPRVNWSPILKQHTAEKTNLLGFIGYKVGMASAFVKDNTPDSMTKNKRIILPVTIIECPTAKILSVRLYKDGKVAKEIMNENIDKEMKRVVKFPKNKINIKEELDKIKEGDFEDLRLIIYSEPKKINLKKTPDVSEIALSGNKNEKLEFVKANIAKEINVAEVFPKGLVDTRGITKGKGFQGSVKRFGVRLRSHKAEKGQRKVGSIGGWHPTGVRFNVPRPGQMGFFTRIVYNSPIISSRKHETLEKEIVSKVFPHYGTLKGDMVILLGSVQGSQKRQILLTAPLRPHKRQIKKNYELVELR